MNEMNRNLLIVDDEQSVINSLKRAFKDKGYNILTSNNGEDALHVFEENHADESIGVVLSDFQMPGMKGTELLAEVKKHSPETVRILLTGQANEVSVDSAVNEGSLHKFMSKPWDQTSLLTTVDDAFKQYELVKENKKLTEELQLLNKNLEEQVQTKAQQLMQAVYYDELTGLPSKMLIRDRLQQAIKIAKRTSTSVSVMFIGVDNLNFINQSLGQKTGDKLLRSIAERLSSVMRASDSLSRINADKFCLVFPNKETNEKPSVVAEKLLASMRAPFIVDGQNLFLTVSVGISLYPVDGEKADELFLHAETAMQKVKNDGKDNYRFYSKELGELANKRFSLESDLRKAIDKQEFCIHYQPRISISENKIVGAEALMRWNHPTRGIVYPNEFIPMLEETGMIEVVGEWLVHHSIKTLKSWQTQGVPDIHLAINLSARQFYQGRILEVTQDAINQAGLDITRSNIEFEITESLLIEDVVLARSILDELNRMGILLAIDDFGTGYSSLSYLTQFPVHYLKIDRSFVMSLEKSRNAKAIVSAVISLAHNLNLNVIAEGIETIGQLDALTSMGCNEYQGFLFSKAVEENQFIKLLNQSEGQLLLGG